MAGPLKRVRSRFSGLLQAILPFDRSDAPAQSRPERQGNIAPPVESPSHAMRVAALPAFVLVRHPRARRYVIRVRPDRTVRVTIPRWGSNARGWRLPSVSARGSRISSGGWMRSGPNHATRLRRMPPATCARVRCVNCRASPRACPVARSRGLAHQHQKSEVALGIVLTRRSHLSELAARGDARLGARLRPHPRADAPETPRSLAEILELVAAACPNYKEARVWLRTHEHLLSVAMN